MDSDQGHSYPCFVSRIDTCKDSRKTLDIICVSKDEVVCEVQPEVIMCFVRTKRML